MLIRLTRKMMTIGGQNDGHDDDVATFKVLILQQDQVVRVHHLVVDDIICQPDITDLSFDGSANIRL